MSEPKQEEKKGKLNLRERAVNIFKRAGNAMGAKFHYSGEDIRTFDTFKALDKLLNYNAIADLNDQQRETEGIWDGAPGTRHSHVNVAAFRDKIRDLYCKFNEKTEINDSIGPFTDPVQLLNEGLAAETGTGISLASKPDLKMKDLQTMKVDLANGRGFNTTFSLPAHLPIIYDDGRVDNEESIKRYDAPYIAYEVAFFGYQGVYFSHLLDDIRIICEKARNEAISTETDPVKIVNIKRNIEVIRRKMTALVSKFETEAIKPFENAHRSALIGSTGVKNFHNTAEAAYSELKKLRLTDDRVFFTHTYKILKPIKLIKKQLPEDKVTRRIKVEKKLLKDQMDRMANPPFWQQPDEEDYGLDENGWPLEIGDGETEFDGKILPHGLVLVDRYKNEAAKMEIEVLNEKLSIVRDPEERSQIERKIAEKRNEIANRRERYVPHEFIEDCDILERAMWHYVSFDAYRDDMRDGRHHPNAISVMDRIMTELGLDKVPDIRHGGTMQNIEKGIQTRYEMKHNAPPDYRREPTIKGRITPSQWNPAFDLRALDKSIRGKFLNRKKFRHIGRVYYYELQDNLYLSPYPTISTRGVAMYILHRVIEETKYFQSHEGKAGVLEVLEAIGEKTKGFDIGPNMGPTQVDPHTHEETEPGWGQPFTKNPFRPKRY